MKKTITTTILAILLSAVSIQATHMDELHEMQMMRLERNIMSQFIEKSTRASLFEFGEELFQKYHPKYFDRNTEPQEILKDSHSIIIKIDEILTFRTELSSTIDFSNSEDNHNRISATTALVEDMIHVISRIQNKVFNFASLDGGEQEAQGETFKEEMSYLFSELIEFNLIASIRLEELTKPHY